MEDNGYDDDDDDGGGANAVRGKNDYTMHDADDDEEDEEQDTEEHVQHRLHRFDFFCKRMPWRELHRDIVTAPAQIEALIMTSTANSAARDGYSDNVTGDLGDSSASDNSQMLLPLLHRLKDALQEQYHHIRRRRRLVRRDLRKLKEYQQDPQDDSGGLLPYSPPYFLPLMKRFIVSRDDSKSHVNDATTPALSAEESAEWIRRRLWRRQVPQCGMINQRGMPCQRVGYCTIHNRQPSTLAHNATLTQQQLHHRHHQHHHQQMSTMVMAVQPTMTHHQQDLQTHGASVATASKDDGDGDVTMDAVKQPSLPLPATAAATAVPATQQIETSTAAPVTSSSLIDTDHGHRTTPMVIGGQRLQEDGSSGDTGDSRQSLMHMSVLMLAAAAMERSQKQQKQDNADNADNGDGDTEMKECNEQQQQQQGEEGQSVTERVLQVEQEQAQQQQEEEEQPPSTGTETVGMES